MSTPSSVNLVAREIPLSKPRLCRLMGRVFPDHHGGTYLGTFFGCDVEVVGNSPNFSISAQYGAEPHQYASQAIDHFEYTLTGGIGVDGVSMPFWEYLVSPKANQTGKAMATGMMILGARRWSSQFEKATPLQPVKDVETLRAVMKHLSNEFGSGWDTVHSADEITVNGKTIALSDAVDAWLTRNPPVSSIF